MIRASLLTVGVLTLVAVPVPATASSTAAAPAYCLIDAVADFPTGLSVTPGTGTYTTEGTATCFGSPGGIEPMGVGTYTSSGGFEGSCGGLVGDFVNRIELSTADGKQTLTDSGTLVAMGSGYSFGERSTGPFEIVEFAGDCVTTPLTNARFLAQFYIHG